MFFKKKNKEEFDDKWVDIPGVWKLLGMIAVIVGLFIAAEKVTKWVYTEDVKSQYTEEYYEEIM